MESSVQSVLFIAYRIYNACQDAKAAKKVLAIVAFKMENLIQVLQQLTPKGGRRNAESDAILIKVLNDLDTEIRSVQKIVDKTMKMNRVLYIIKAKGIHEELNESLSQIHFSLMTLEIHNSSQIQKIIQNFHEQWKAREAELKEQERQDQNDPLIVMQGATIKQQAEKLRQVIQGKDEIEQELRQVQAARTELQRELQGVKDSVAQGKARIEEEAMAQVIAALQQLEIESDAAPSGDNDPDYFLCPVSAEIMTDPVIVGASCGHTVARETHKRWTETKRTCPVCGIELRSIHVAPNVPLRDAVSHYLANQANPPSTERPPTNNPLPPIRLPASIVQIFDNIPRVVQ